MEKNFFNKAKDFFKKEGFYVILFICLCILATVAVVTIKSNKHDDVALQKNNEIQQKNAKQTVKTNSESSQKYDNAMQVKKATKVQTAVPNNETNSQNVSNTTSISLDKPVEGTIARAYSEDPVYWDSTSSYRPNLGVDIKADLGKTVVAAMDGKVEEISNTQDGVQVVINHQNGLKTVYSNLDEKVRVTKGQSVSKGAAIGTVGKTTLRSAYEKYGDHLHFAVLKGNDFIDPGKYIKY